MKYVIILAMMMVALGVSAADLQREERMASEIEDAILDGDPVYLRVDEDDEGYRFLAIYTEAEEAVGAALIMHGRGFHPDWADTTNPLRVGLAERGWNTLSIQMPVLAKGAKYYDYAEILPEAFPRIEAAISYLQGQGNKKIVLIAHSCSFHMVNAWIKAGRFRGADALVGIGMGATDYKQAMIDDFQLDKLTVPILDVYGSEDYAAVHRMREHRLNKIRATGQSDSKQVKVEGADHYFVDKGDELVDVIASWLDSL